MKKNLLQVFTAFLRLSLLFATQLSAQQLATLNVTVTDPSGSVVSQARVILRNLETDGKRTDFSSVTGVAVVPGLPADKYQLTVGSSQFSTYQGSLTLTVGQNASIPVMLGLKTVQEDVEVQETAQGVDPQKSEVSQVIDSQKIADLPISGRDFIDFVLLTPSVNVGRSTAVGAQSPFQETVLQLSFAGLRETHSASFGLDGTDYTISISSAPARRRTGCANSASPPVHPRWTAGAISALS